MADDPASLFWGMGIDLELTNALTVALGQVDQAAADNGRMVTQVSHTVTVLPGSHPIVQAGFQSMHDHRKPAKGKDYAVVTVTATTISRP
ncbi:hypothetical protein [Allobranchiibius sp. GilTou38]|uniref:hypothetical protein n=1 Tax=Allobranchiibius sp. GilTou38 TaxID=2815210 RepID=UPI001AA0C99F|nr:hypothetical protein [Allobranchiibius sp. GilTou38]MBO1768244.1 hypothetical protein [Allobranchiibius sp. GilTou38]